MALKGIKVLEFEALPPLQFLGQMLADQGATVIIVKQPSQNKPVHFAFLNRGESQIELNLKHKQDTNFVLQSVIPHVDVVLESFRPGVMEKLDLCPKAVHQKNAKVVYLRMSGWGQMKSKQQLQAGHDITYLALSGLLSIFKRTSSKSAPAFPSNLLADFASASTYGFNLVLQGLLVRKPNTAVLLEAVQTDDRLRNKNKLPLTHFTRPHECVYKDNDGVLFVLKPGSKIYENAELQRYTTEEHDHSQMLSDIHQNVFDTLTIEQIVKEYGPVEVLRNIFENVKNPSEAQISKGLVVNGSIQNVYDQHLKVNSVGSTDERQGWNTLINIGVDPAIVKQKMPEFNPKL